MSRQRRKEFSQGLGAGSVSRRPSTTARFSSIPARIRAVSPVGPAVIPWWSVWEVGADPPPGHRAAGQDANLPGAPLNG